MSVNSVGKLYENLSGHGAVDGGGHKDVPPMERFAATAEAWMNDRPSDVREMLAMHTRFLVDHLQVIWRGDLDGEDSPLNDPMVACTLADLCALGGATPPATVIERMP